MSRLLRHFDSRPMGVKLTAVFLLVILIPMTLLAWISYRVIDSRLVEDAKEKMTLGLNTARSEYYVRGEQMRYGMLQAASTDEIKSAVAGGDASYLKKRMSRWKLMRPYVDLWSVVDSGSRVLVRLNSDHSGDVLKLNGLVSQALAVGEPFMSTEVITREQLKKEWAGLQEMLFPGRVTGEEAPLIKEALALVVVTPVFDGKEVAGAIITADILNNDPYVPESLSRKLPSMFSTISQRGMRITTNMVDGDGRGARMTRLPPDVLRELDSGRTVFRELELPGKTYMAVFDPIRDNKGKIVGSIDVAMSRETLWQMQKETQWVITLITLVGLIVSVSAAVVSTSRITRPLKDLKARLADFASGDRTARVDVRMDSGGDELDVLARTFNDMMGVVTGREEEREEHLRKIEAKNSALTRLNLEHKEANEELEVAYEETQSQTEELHAINEELKLLNEDLDRKNVELKEANRIIKLEEDELKGARNKLRLIYDSIRDYIILVDRDRNILEANRQLTADLGIDPDEVAERDLFSLFKLGIPVNDCPVRASIDGGEPMEREVVSEDGRVFECHSYPLEGDDGSKRAVVYIRDVTEQRLMSQKLIQSDKLSSLGELVSGVAHELNNPLTGIMCFSELLMDDGLPEGAKEKLGKINDASHRCKKIVDNLLTFARWHSPEKTLEDVNRVVAESVELRSYQLRVDNIEVETDLDHDVPLTMVDPHQLQQVFLNLINNARDAMVDEGGGRLTITSARDDGVVVVRFEDTGPGMEDEVAGRIFDPFFTTKEVGSGTGLGLSISYGIINEHGGNIYASSRPGQGACFAVELPVVEEAAGAAEDDEPLAGKEDFRAMAEGRVACVVDDEPIVLDLVEDALTSCGFRVESSSSGAEALRMIRKKKYDIIISDIKMPGMNGPAFYEEVRAIDPGCVDRLVFISGDTVSEETRAFLESVDSPHLRKPFTVDELVGLVARVLG